MSTFKCVLDVQVLEQARPGDPADNNPRIDSNHDNVLAVQGRAEVMDVAEAGVSLSVIRPR